MLKKIAKITGWIAGTFVLLLGALILYTVYGTDAEPSYSPPAASLAWVVTEPSPGLFKVNKNWSRKSESGLYEVYVEGGPFERGLALGKLTRELVQYQEEVFTQQLRRLVPSSLYLNFLKYTVRFFNRNLQQNVAPEYQIEILGVSRAASHEFDFIGSPYQRMLNYHAAHDIGHALQNVAMVGCTSFATWGDRSDDGSLIIGRNFDFYMGDAFGKNKIIAFYRPDSGHKFMMVTFGGMTGVLSGMNDQGLTVTINAAKSDIVTASATPVSLVAREILQYASNLKEAFAIAEKRKMFVAESFLIGSARDGKAALIEKNPESTDLFEAKENFIVSTNHFQGVPLGNTSLNQDHIKASASWYRYQRTMELMGKHKKNSVVFTAAILRDQRGRSDADIGLGNEKAVNQLIAHHSIIFEPEKGLVWVSTAPWQLGKYVCYDLKKVFELPMETNHEIYEEARVIPADSFATTAPFHDYLKFSPYRFPFNDRAELQPDSIIKWNPRSYQAYLLAGDYLFEHKKYAEAIPIYEKGLTLEIATIPEQEHMKKNLASCKDKLK